mmetsp:Transcript_19452/g.51898  ORF Transcript_19452/g.51898 Transcript_19452/m.51898 type:complete len:235 (-) Transcript_19452:499-1203(-)
MVVRALEEYRAAVRILHPLDEGVLLVAERLFVDGIRFAEIVDVQILHGVHRDTTHCEGESLHVAPLRSAKCDDPLTREYLQRGRVNALLVDQNEGLLVLFRAHLALELADFLHLVVSEFALGVRELVALRGGTVEKSSVHLALLILQRDVHGENVAIVEPLRHVWMSRTVIHDQSPDKGRLVAELVLHVHDLDHVQVHRHVRLLDNLDCINHCLRHLVRHLRAELRPEGRSGNA